MDKRMEAVKAEECLEVEDGILTDCLADQEDLDLEKVADRARE